VLATSTHKELLFFSNQGRVFSTHAYEIPVMSRMARGQALQNFLELGGEEKITEVIALPTKEERGEYFIMATRKGLIKKTKCSEFAHIRRSGLKAITLKNDDTLEWVASSSGSDEVMLVSQRGQAIRFQEKDIRFMGRTAAGVKGMRLKKTDQLIAMHLIPSDEQKNHFVLVITSRGFGKWSPLAVYRLQGRGGSGIRTAQVTPKTGEIVNALIADKAVIDESDLLITTEKGQTIRIAARSVSQQGRSTQGVRVMRPSEESGLVATFALLKSEITA
jgi:DNA gyrase subunit A